MVANSQINIRKPRLNPFAFPSNTDFRFVMLIVAVLGASLLIYYFLYYTIPANAETIKATYVSCYKAARAAHPGSSLADQNAWVNESIQCMAPINRSLAAWVGLGVALLLGVTGAIYWIFPIWKIWRGGLNLLSAGNAPPGLLASLADLCGKSELSRSPVFLLNPYSSANSGVAFGRLGRYYVVLHSGLVMLFQTDQPAFCAIVLHELAHIRNADVDKTYFTIAIGWAFGLTALLPWVVCRFWPPWNFDQLFNAGWRVLALTALIYLIRNAVLRSREVYADVRAFAGDGQGRALGRVLESLPRLKGGRWRRLLHKHPEPEERRRVLDDTSGLFQQSFWDAFVTGVVVASVIINVYWLLGLLYGEGIGSIGAGMIFAPLVVGIVGLGVWRATFARQARGEALPSAIRVSLGLTLGLLLGQPLSLFAYGTGSGFFTDLGFTGAGLASLGPFTLPPLLARAGLSLLIGIVLLIVVFFFLRWVVVTAGTWLEVASRSSSPRRTYWIGLAIASGVLAILFGQFSLLSSFAQELLGSPGLVQLVSAGLGTKVSALDLVVLVLFQDPFITLLFISLWTYPLATWFWRRRAGTITQAGWAFMDSSFQARQLAAPYRELFRPGLALVMGVAGGLAYCVLLLLFLNGFKLNLSIEDGIVLAVLLQVGIAAIVAGSVRRLGALHGLFAAFVSGCTMTVGIVGIGLLYNGQTDFASVWTDLEGILNGGALLVLPVALVVSILASWVRRLSRQAVVQSAT